MLSNFNSLGCMILSMWSGPRNVSTAMMYAFAQRPDTTVIDEPLYGHYLANSDAQHPGQELVLENMPKDGNEIIENFLDQKNSSDLLFLKNMAHHLTGIDLGLLQEMNHFLLIRNPKEVLSSLIKQIPKPKIRDTGFQELVQLVQKIENIVVIDSNDLLNDPEKTLKILCARLNIPWYKQMLSWEDGPKEYDGIWAPFWYHNVHQSTGFMPHEQKDSTLPPSLEPLHSECLFYYEQLKKYAL